MSTKTIPTTTPSVTTTATGPTDVQPVREGVFENVFDLSRAHAGIAATARMVSEHLNTAATSSDMISTALDGGVGFLEKAKRISSATGITAERVSSVAKVLENSAIGLSAINAAATSDTSTTAMKVTEGVVNAGLTKVMIGGLTKLAEGSKATNPYMLGDLLLNTVGEKALVLAGVGRESAKEKMKMAGGFISGHTISTPAKLVTAYADAMINGDMTALDKFAQEGKTGDYGVVYKAALGAGQVISDKLDLASGIEAGVAAAKTVAAKWNKAVSFFGGR